MFGLKKKAAPAIDLEQKELIENAQRRIKQKRGLFTHFVVFLVASVGFIIISQVLMQGDSVLLFSVPWWVWAIFIWLLLLLYHAFKVFITQRLLGPEWEKRQYARLVEKQKVKIEELKQKVEKNQPLPQVTAVVEEPMQRTVTMIAAVDGNLGLGKDNGIVWHLPDDFKRFKQLTTGHHIIMGRKTFESFPKPLPGRTHIVLTRDPDYTTSGGIVVHDMEMALAACGDDMQPFIIGGGEIYKLGMPYTDRIELTRIHDVFEVDTYFPEINKRRFKLVNTVHHDSDDRHKHSFEFETWERK